MYKYNRIVHYHPSAIFIHTMYNDEWITFLVYRFSVELCSVFTLIMKFSLRLKTNSPLFCSVLNLNNAFYNRYGTQVDVWAAGVIMYILVCGFPPFSSAKNDQEELFDAILSGKFDFPSPYWDDISEEAKVRSCSKTFFNISFHFLNHIYFTYYFC